jgi:peroxiredoxin
MARGSAQINPGDVAPEFRLKDAEGQEFTLAGLRAQGPTLLAFYKVSCPTCQFTLPYLQRLRGGQVQIVAVCQDKPDYAAEFDREFGTALATLFDTPESGYPASNAYGLTTVPALFLVEPDGRIGWKSEGFFRQELEQLAARAGLPIFQAGERVPEAKYG